MPRNALMIDYEFCTGCHTCEVACKQEHDYPVGKGGIHLIEVQTSFRTAGCGSTTYRSPPPIATCAPAASRKASSRPASSTARPRSCTSVRSANSRR